MEQSQILFTPVEPLSGSEEGNFNILARLRLWFRYLYLLDGSSTLTYHHPRVWAKELSVQRPGSIGERGIVLELHWF